MDFKFSQWGSHSERVLTFNMNIQHPLFWSIWRWGRGLTSNDDLKCQLHKSFKASISNPGQWGLSFEIFFLLALISASSTDLQKIQTPDCLFRDFREVKSWPKPLHCLQLVDQDAEFKFESNFSPFCLSGIYSQQLYQKAIKVFDSHVGTCIYLLLI